MSGWSGIERRSRICRLGSYARDKPRLDRLLSSECERDDVSKRAIVGYVLHMLIAVCMLLAGIAKLLGYIEQPGPLNRFNVVIGLGETATAVLLVVPRIWSLAPRFLNRFSERRTTIHNRVLELERGVLQVDVAEVAPLRLNPEL